MNRWPFIYYASYSQTFFHYQRWPKAQEEGLYNLLSLFVEAVSALRFWNKFVLMRVSLGTPRKPHDLSLPLIWRDTSVYCSKSSKGKDPANVRRRPCLGKDAYAVAKRRIIRPQPLRINDQFLPDIISMNESPLWICLWCHWGLHGSPFRPTSWNLLWNLNGSKPRASERKAASSPLLEAPLIVIPYLSYNTPH